MKNTWLLRLSIVINFLLIIPVNNAQNSSMSFLDDVMEDISVNNDEEEELNWENVIEELSERIQQPVNLNSATKEQLEQFPFLNDIQIENLLAYVYINGQMQTIYELQLVEEMDWETIHYLLPFVCVQPVHKREAYPSLKSIFKYGKHELLTRMDIPFYTRKGYEQTYLGPPVYHSLRYGFRYKEHIYAGMTGEKDAGEPFGALHNKQGYDYYSYYLFISRLGRLKTLALGNYRLSFGQGLVISTDFLMGKGASFSSFTFRSGGIRKHSSTDEYNYFRGIAAAVNLNKYFVLSGFYSYRHMDGVVQEGEITSIYKTGLHRSRKEADKKNVFTMQLAGGNITYTDNHLKLGLTGIYYFFNHPFEPDLWEYSKYNMHGNRFYNAGLEYGYRWHRFSFQGETAIGKYPVETVKTMATIAERTENDIDYVKRLDRMNFDSRMDVTNAISHATCTTAHDLHAAAIIALTYSGGTAMQLSKFRPTCPIIAPTLSVKARRQLNLSWGVIPIMSETRKNTDELFDHAVECAQKTGLIKDGDLVVITGGAPMGVAGTTNIMKVHLVGHILVSGRGLDSINATANVCVATSYEELKNSFCDGDIVVTNNVTKNMIPILKKSAGIISEEVGEANNASVLAVALDIPVIVAAAGATKVLKSGTTITMDAKRGLVYSGMEEIN